MIPRYKAWDKELQTMLDVSLIDFKKRVLVGEHWKFGETNFMSFDEIELMQSIDALRNFMTPEQLKGFYLGNALKYQLRFQKKNGLEDLKKARKNLDWLIEEMEHEN